MLYKNQIQISSRDLEITKPKIATYVSCPYTFDCNCSFFIYIDKKYTYTYII